MSENMKEFSPVKLVKAGVGQASKNLQTGPFSQANQQLSQKSKMQIAANLCTDRSP